MFDGFSCDAATSGGAFEEAELHEVRFVEIFDSGGFVASECGDGVEADGAIGVVGVHESEHVAVGGVEAEFVNFEHFEGAFGDLFGDVAVGVDVGVVADAF